MKSLLVVVFLLLSNFCYTQDYLNFSSGFNNRYAFFLNSKVDNKDNLYWGFGISIVTNQGKRGQDFTSFIIPGIDSSFGGAYRQTEFNKITPILTGDASIFGSFGFKTKSNILFSGRLGFYTKKLIYNGKGTDGFYGGDLDPIGGLIKERVPNQEWYIIKDGGTRFLYGVVVSKNFKNFSIGSSYDNFNGLMATVGFRFN
jgi:hypothetical protein